MIEQALEVSGERTKKAAVTRALDGGDAIVTTGLVLQELLQGFAGLRARKDIVQRFAALPLRHAVVVSPPSP